MLTYTIIQIVCEIYCDTSNAILSTVVIVTWTLLSSMVGGGSLAKQVRCASLTDKAKFWGNFFGWVHKWRIGEIGLFFLR